MTEQTFTPEETCGLVNALGKLVEFYDYDLDKVSKIIGTDVEALSNKVGAIFDKNNGWDDV